MITRCAFCRRITPGNGDDDEELLLACGWHYHDAEGWLCGNCWSILEYAGQV